MFHGPGVSRFRVDHSELRPGGGEYNINNLSIMGSLLLKLQLCCFLALLARPCFALPNEKMCAGPFQTHLTSAFGKPLRCCTTGPDMKKSDPAHQAEVREISTQEVAGKFVNLHLYGEDSETPGYENVDDLQIRPEPVSGKYLWGFKHADFNEEGDPLKGREKFQSLLDLFHLKPHPEDAKPRRHERANSIFPSWTFGNLGPPKPFEWSDEELSLLLLTNNNPISGQYSDPSVREDEIGYLSYVGIECKNERRLKDFIKEFKARATDIKDESPGERLFI